MTQAEMEHMRALLNRSLNERLEDTELVELAELWDRFTTAVRSQPSTVAEIVSATITSLGPIISVLTQHMELQDTHD